VDTAAARLLGLLGLRRGGATPDVLSVFADQKPPKDLSLLANWLLRRVRGGAAGVHSSVTPYPAPRCTLRPPTSRV
jgi:hypothetical protein